MTPEKRRSNEPDPCSPQDLKWLQDVYDDKKGILRKAQELLYEVDPIKELEPNIGTVRNDLEKMLRWTESISPQRRAYFGSLNSVQYGIKKVIKILKVVKGLIRKHNENENNMEIVNNCFYYIQEDLDQCRSLIDDILSEFSR